MATVRIIIKPSKTNAQGETPIFIRYIHKGKDVLIATGHKITPSGWHQPKGEVRKSYSGHIALNDILDKIKNKVRKIAHSLESEGLEPEPDLVKSRFNEEVKGNQAHKITSILSLWKSYLVNRKETVSAPTYKNEYSSMETFQQFLEEKKKAAVSFKALIKDVIQEYDIFLNTYANNTKAKRLKHLKAFLRSVDHPVVKHITPKEKPGNKIFVTEEELKKFADYDLRDKPHLDRIRDLFILQCATGLRVSDLMRLGKQHIHDDFILLRAFKNRSDLRIPVVPQIQEIMKKYDFKIPSISSDTYNYYLKELAKDVIPKSTVEITEERNNQKIRKTALKHDVLSSHAAVRTFITLSAQRGMPVSSIAKITGKTVGVLLRNYLGLDESQAARDMIKYWGDPKLKVA